MSFDAVARDLTAYACAKLERNCRQIRRCVENLSTTEIWRRPNERSNSIGNLILHLSGNARQWIAAGVGGEAFERDRGAEFAHREEMPTAVIVERLESTVTRACEIIHGLSELDLGAVRQIQGYSISTVVAVMHVVEHFSLHTGQIVYATKLLNDADLSLYDAKGRLLNDRYENFP